MTEREITPFDRAILMARLRAATPARIGLGRTGVSIDTADHLAFQIAHALARDAVHDALDVDAMITALRARSRDAIAVASAAPDRATYLARPDLGRRLDAPSREKLARFDGGFEKAPRGVMTPTPALHFAGGGDASLDLRRADHPNDIAIVIADGLSARAVAIHALPVLDRLVPMLTRAGATLGPLVVASQARVALGDEIGALLRARLVCMLIGERPGLSAPDSLGIYLTSQPAVGCTDAQRNCLSNIRPAGMGYDEAATRCAWLIDEAQRRGATGYALKDESGGIALPPRDPRTVPRDPDV